MNEAWWFSRSDAEVIASLVFAYLTNIVYAIETIYLRNYAPANFGKIGIIVVLSYQIPVSIVHWFIAYIRRTIRRILLPVL